MSMNMGLGVFALIGIIFVVTAGVLVTSDLLPGISMEKQIQEPTELTSNDGGEGANDEPSDDSATNENDEKEDEEIVIFTKSGGGGGSSYTSSSSSSTTPTPTPTPPPVLTADAGGPYTGFVGESLTLDGSASYDPDSDGSIVNYTWKTDEFGTMYGVTVTFVPSANDVGNYSVNLTITDNNGDTATNSTTVEIIAVPPEDTQNPVINSVTLGNYTPSVGETITIIVNATDDIGVTNVTVDDTELTEHTGDIWTGSIEAIEGIHTVNVSALDTAGNITWDNSTTYTAIEDVPVTNLPPVSIPGGPYTGFVGESLTLDGSASYDPDLDGSIISYAWETEGFETMYGVNITFTPTTDDVGNHSVQLTVTDNNGSESSNTTYVNITVRPDPESDVLTADASGPSAGIANETITFDGSASFDPAGDITNYTWEFGDTNIGYGEIVDHVYDAEGTYTVNLTITNGTNDKATDSTIIRIYPVGFEFDLVWNSTLMMWEGTVIDGEADKNEIFGAETNVGGKTIYGTQWQPTIRGFYRITFSLEKESNAYFDKSTVIYTDEDKLPGEDIVNSLSDLIGIQHEADPDAPVANDTNCLSYPAIFSEDVRMQRGTFGVEKFDGVYYWTWGYLNPDPTNVNDDFKFKQPLSCLPGDESNDPNNPLTATCLPGSETIPGEHTPGIYTGVYEHTLYDNVVASFIQKQPENEWRAQTEENPGNNSILVTHIDIGDNIESVSWKVGQKVRVETAMFQKRIDSTEYMVGYRMLHTLEHGPDEVWGTTRVRYLNEMPIVYSSHAHLTIQKLTGDPEDFTSMGILSEPDLSDVKSVVMPEHNLAYIDLEIV